MFVHTINPVLLSLGPFEIRYYGIVYALAFVFAFLFLHRARKSENLPLSREEVDSLMVSVVIGTLVGARLFEVLFYHPAFYFRHPLEIFALWHGGLSFHGGFIGVVIAVALFCRNKKVSLLQIGDHLVIAAALSLALGRIANFINGELYGRITTLPWAVKFPGAEGFRHPSQVYEAVKNTAIFVTLLRVNPSRHREGYRVALFLLLYGVFRFVIEFVREPEVFVGPLTMGQVLSLPMIALGLWMVKRTSKA